MIEASEFAGAQKPVFEPSELMDHGDAKDLTRAGQLVNQDAANGYES